jgi:predicted DNA-binding protein YlxM (UPF0122 family)
MSENPDLGDLISIADAAQIREVSYQAIQDLIKREKLSVTEIAGRKLLSRREVENYKSESGGRPSKAKE